MMKKGFTLIEFIVATSIFVVVMTVAIGSFITLTRLKIQLANMKNTQQKGRIAMENITRYAKEAKLVTLEDELKKPNTSGPGWVSNTPQKYKTAIFSYDASLNFHPIKITISNPLPGSGGNDTGELKICEDFDLLNHRCNLSEYKLLGLNERNTGTGIDPAFTSDNYFVIHGNTTADIEINFHLITTNGGRQYDDNLKLNSLIMLEGLTK